MSGFAYNPKGSCRLLTVPTIIKVPYVSMILLYFRRYKRQSRYLGARLPKVAGPTYKESGKVKHVSASPEAKHLDSTKPPPHVASSRNEDFQLIQLK